VTLAPCHRGMHALWDQEGVSSVVRSAAEMGKSQNLAARIAYEIGQNPGIRVALLSGTQQQAEGLLRAVVIIINNPVYQEVFPGVHIVRSTASEFQVSPRPETIKDPTVFAAAVDQSSNLSRRVDLACLDDIVTLEGVRSQQTRDRAYGDALQVTGSRVAPGGRILVVNTSSHPDDVPSRLAKLPGWISQSFPVLNPDGSSAWPERWPLERIEARRQALGPLRFAAIMLCDPSDEASLCFAHVYIEGALANGLATQHSEIPEGSSSVLGVDPAMSSKPSADLSGLVLVTIGGDGFRNVVQVEGLRLNYEKLVSRVCELARISKAVVHCESNAGGSLLADMIGKQVPCRAWSTSKASKESRIETLSAELASNRWVFRQPLGYPSPELRALVSDMSTFSYDRHCGDRLAALLMCVEGIRAEENRPRGGSFKLGLNAAGHWRIG
jgi:hypothetical protein